MIQIVITAFVSLIMIAVAAIARPTTARCPRGWNMGDGIRRDGSYACHAPLPRGCGEPVGKFIPCPPVPKLYGRIYCTNGQQPIVINHERVGCQARH